MENLHSLIEHQRRYFESGKTLDIDFRLRRLIQLERAIRQYTKPLLAALQKDLGKCATESYATEIGLVLSEITYMKHRLRFFAMKKTVPSSILQFPGISQIYREPYGVTLIISPWNYPVQLTLSPLVGAIAAGNCVTIKPSELSPSVSGVLTELIESVFPKYYAAVVNGGADVSARLLDEKFDYIFYTGGSRVGKLVMEKAAAHLTPLSLELGGKSPCIVDETADLKMAARRILWGKCLNSGQTCVAPDYVLVDKKVEGELLCQLKKAAEDFYENRALDCPRWPKMINRRHFERVSAFLKDGDIVCGGRTDAKTLKIEPTVLACVKRTDAVMQEEIFGPVLPVLTFDTIGDAVRFVKAGDRPLALYIFSENKKTCEYILKHCHFGGGCVNETILHIVSHTMPFGGNGMSGMGSYHGKYSFNTFSREKSVLKKLSHPDIFLRYPNWWQMTDKVFKK